MNSKKNSCRGNYMRKYGRWEKFLKKNKICCTLIREFRAGRAFKENGKKIENGTYLSFSLIGHGEILLNHANDCQKMPN